jgi:hypothetical protein
MKTVWSLSEFSIHFTVVDDNPWYKVEGALHSDFKGVWTTPEVSWASYGMIKLSDAYDFKDLLDEALKTAVQLESATIKTFKVSGINGEKVFQMVYAGMSLEHVQRVIAEQIKDRPEITKIIVTEETDNV